MLSLRYLFLNKLQASEGGLLGLTPLLELPTLEDMHISNCDDLDDTRETESSRISPSLTRLHLNIPHLPNDPGIPALGQLSHLISLRLKYGLQGMIFIVPSCLSSLLCLQALTTGPDFYWGMDHQHSYDNTAFALLGPAIKYWLQGNTELVASSSLTTLADQPNLQMADPDGDCSVSLDGPHWLHCAAFLHALVTRPSRRLSAVRMQPDLALY